MWPQSHWSIEPLHYLNVMNDGIDDFFAEKDKTKHQDLALLLVSELQRRGCYDIPSRYWELAKGDTYFLSMFHNAQLRMICFSLDDLGKLVHDFNACLLYARIYTEPTPPPHPQLFDDQWVVERERCYWQRIRRQQNRQHVDIISPQCPHVHPVPFLAGSRRWNLRKNLRRQKARRRMDDATVTSAEDESGIFC